MTDVESKTLTKTERNHQANLNRRAEQKRRTKERQEAVRERDEKINQVNEAFIPKINELKEMHRRELKKIWDEWRKRRNDDS